MCGCVFKYASNPPPPLFSFSIRLEDSVQDLIDLRAELQRESSVSGLSTFVDHNNNLQYMLLRRIEND